MLIICIYIQQYICIVKEESEKAGLKLNIPNTKIMASGTIISWKIDGETMETVTDFILRASKSLRTSLVAQTVKHLSTMRETWLQSLGQEDPLEKEMAIHSSTIAWKISWTEDPGRLHTAHGVAKSWT